MEYCQNILLSQEDLHQQQPDQEQLLHNTLDDFFSTHHTTTERDMSLEWLSVFVEDCLTSSGTCLPPPQQQKAEMTQVKNNKLAPPQFLHKFVIPGKARSKRKRRTPFAQKSQNTTFFSSWPKNQKTQLGVVPFLDTPLLNQAYWLADSELITMPENKEGNGHKEEEEDDSTSNVQQQQQQQQQGRRCSHCLAQKTPQWRGGPLGPKTLCNACGVRYKKGRLFPEYRPAKSPTFVSYKHSNSHKKVLEMRSMATIPN